MHNGEIETGPFTLEELSFKSVKRETLFWCEGLESWKTAEELDELKPLIASIRPPILEQNQTRVSTPPPLQQRNDINADYRNAFPEKKKSSMNLFTALGWIGAVSIVVWFASERYNSFTNNNLQSDLSYKAVGSEQIEEIVVDVKEVERQKVNAALTLKNMNLRNNWESYITLSNNEPNVDYTLGGISEFPLYVSNNTQYMLEQVDVRVDYIRKNGNVYQSSIVHLFNIPADASQGEVAPSSINGVKVNCIIEKIISKKMHFCYPLNNGNPKDPFFCKP